MFRGFSSCLLDSMIFRPVVRWNIMQGICGAGKLLREAGVGGEKGLCSQYPLQGHATSNLTSFC